MPDHHRSLEEIEGDRWGGPPAGATRLVGAVHVLRRKPVGELESRTCGCSSLGLAALGRRFAQAL